MPWTESVVQDAPGYGEEDDRGLVTHETGGIAISPEKERLPTCTTGSSRLM